jgi:TPR repeat protein
VVSQGRRTGQCDSAVAARDQIFKRPGRAEGAAAWQRKAANQGSVLAQVKLGMLYEQGQGVPKDYTQAVTWYCKAIAQGDPTSEFMLGMLYFQGEGVKKDYVSAYALLSHAAASPSPSQSNAVGMRDAVMKAMSKEEINAGKGLVGQMQRIGVLQALSGKH